jgi:FixJ family two-component response regulator
MIPLSTVPEFASGSPPDPHPEPVVFIMDEDLTFRDELASLVADAGFRPQACASAAEFLSQERPVGARCLVLDVHISDVGGLILQQRLAEERANIPVIFTTRRGDIPMTVSAMKAGAIDVLMKPFSDVMVLEAIRYALRRSEVILEETRRIDNLRQRYAALSRREQEVMALVTSGLMNKQVGNELGISEITVKAHRGKVMRKMQAGSLAELIRLTGLLQVAH